MVDYTDLASPDYPTVGVSADDPAENTDYPENSPMRKAPSAFTFSGLGPEGQLSTMVHVQTAPFAETGFSCITPDALLLALVKHYEGLQRSSVQDSALTRATTALRDALGILKARNDRRAHYGVYGTDKPTLPTGLTK